MTSRKRNSLISLALLLFVVSGWFIYGFLNSSGEDVPTSTLNDLENRTKEFVCDACGKKKSMPALEFMEQTSSIQLMGKVICKECRESGALRGDSPSGNGP